MFTRCPKCQTVHTLSAKQMAQAYGAVKCSNCRSGFNVLDFLFDDWPASTTPAARPERTTPVLGAAPTPESETEAIAGAPPVTDHAPSKIWSLALAALILLTLINGLWTFRDDLRRYPLFSAGLIRLGWIEAEPVDPQGQLSSFHLVSRDMHRHPARTGMLMLSATFVNRGTDAQAYPAISLRLLDATQQELAQRTFTPQEYLSADTPADAVLAPQVHIPILLEFEDPGQKATGFELNFRHN